MIIGRLIGLGSVVVFAFAGAIGTACSSSSNNAGSETDAASGPDTPYEVPDASPWCILDDTSNAAMILAECSKNPGICTVGSYGAASCPTTMGDSGASLAGCCKGTANSLEGPNSEVCIYNDDYIAADGGAEAWCTCMPPTTGCFGGTWQKTP